MNLNKTLQIYIFSYQFELLLLFILQLFNVLRQIWPVKLMVQPPLDLQHFFGDAAEGLCYLMDQLPVVVEVIMGPCPQVSLMSSGRQPAAKNGTNKKQ